MIFSYLGPENFGFQKICGLLAERRYATMDSGPSAGYNSDQQCTILYENHGSDMYGFHAISIITLSKYIFLKTINLMIFHLVISFLCDFLFETLPLGSHFSINPFSNIQYMMRFSNLKRTKADYCSIFGLIMRLKTRECHKIDKFEIAVNFSNIWEHNSIIWMWVIRWIRNFVK